MKCVHCSYWCILSLCDRVVGFPPRFTPPTHCCILFPLTLSWGHSWFGPRRSIPSIGRTKITTSLKKGLPWRNHPRRRRRDRRWLPPFRRSLFLRQRSWSGPSYQEQAGQWSSGQRGTLHREQGTQRCSKKKKKYIPKAGQCQKDINYTQLTRPAVERETHFVRHESAHQFLINPYLFSHFWSGWNKNGSCGALLWAPDWSSQRYVVLCGTYN